jgi:CBS domain-containing protein
MTLSRNTKAVARRPGEPVKLVFIVQLKRGGGVLQQVGDLLDEKGTDVFSIAPAATVAAAVDLMAEKGIGSLLVIEEGALCGIVTERDYARKIVASGLSIDKTSVADIMTVDVLTTGVDQNIDECMMLMTEKRIRHLPVVEGDRVLGIISIGDLMKAIISDNQRALGALDQPVD